MRLDELFANVVVSDSVPADTIMVVATRCGCSHGFTNHLHGRCDVCPCDRSAASMAVKLTIGSGRG